MSKFPTYQIKNRAGLDSPALLVFPNIVEENIRQAIELLGSADKLRPHVKTVKSIEPIQMAMAAGINQFKCSTIAEAELVALAGAPDVLLCYQLSHPRGLRLRSLRELYPATTFSCLVDNKLSAALTSELFADDPIDVMIDVNCGMGRTGIRAEDVSLLYSDIRDLPGIRIVGLHAYDGHIHDQDLEERKDKAAAVTDLVSRVRKQIDDQSLLLVIGGSPTFHLYADLENVHCSPGTFFLWDAGYGAQYPDLPFVPAALVLTRVLSIVDEHILCLDMGSKAVAPDPPLPRAVFPEVSGVQVEGHYEEHMIVRVDQTSKYRVGDAWLAVPIHICPTVNLYQHFVTIEDGVSSGSWKIIARDRIISV
ncbi:MAG: D-TA family PLP-dependent enzyme [Saprospiraceae bacterium]|nr:D-TA family PLP-dependent enzyme [Saprospiraceae bacterium]